MYTSRMYTLKKEKKISSVFPAHMFLKTLHPALSVQIVSWTRLSIYFFVVSLNFIKPQSCPGFETPELFFLTSFGHV